MKKQSLIYRFHNPNPVTATVDYLLGIFVEANFEKVQSVIQAASQKNGHMIAAMDSVEANSESW